MIEIKVDIKDLKGFLVELQKKSIENFIEASCTKKTKENLLSMLKDHGDLYDSIYSETVINVFSKSFK